MSFSLLPAFAWWVVCFALIVGVSIVLTRLMIRVAPRLGLMDQPSSRRIHHHPIPRAGGIAVFGSLLAGIGIFEWLEPGFSTQLDLSWCLYFLSGALLLMIVGVWDDRFGMSPWIKLTAQAAAGLIIYLHDFTPTGSLLGLAIPWQVDMVVHILWTVILINGFNLIDGMDGLCGGIAVISIAILGLLSAVAGQTQHALLCGIMIAALLGFMRYNFHPARIFLGDAGSMMVGFFIASVGEVAAGRQTAAASILLPLLIGGVPLLDLSLAVWRRLARRLVDHVPGKTVVKVFGADKDHLHHRILGWGFSQRQAAFLIYALAIVLSIIGILPTIGGSSWFSISVIGMIVTALVGLRYLAPIEFIASGNGLRALVRRPRSSRVTAFAYYVFDVLALGFSITLATVLFAKATLKTIPPETIASSTMIFIGSCVVGLRFARAQQRRWSRASVHDFAETAVWLLCGIGISFSLHGYASADFLYQDAVTHLTAGGIAITLILVPRSIGFILQESVIDAMHRRRRIHSMNAKKNTLIYGAGDLGELFLCHLRLSQADVWENEHFLGFIDDNVGLTGRRMRGFKILGCLNSLPDLIKVTAVQSILVTMQAIPEKQLKELTELADEFNLEVRFWSPALEPKISRLSTIPNKSLRQSTGNKPLVTRKNSVTA